MKNTEAMQPDQEVWQYVIMQGRRVLEPCSIPPMRPVYGWGVRESLCAFSWRGWKTDLPGRPLILKRRGRSSMPGQSTLMKEDSGYYICSLPQRGDVY